MDIETEILSVALRNALFHGGKADEGAVVSKVLGAHPELRKDAKDVVKRVKAVVKQVNKLSVEVQTEEAAKLGVSLEAEEKIQREGLPELPNAQQGAVITRFAPNPNAPIHLGNARALILSGLYAKKYNGRFIVRFDDTDPRTKVPMKEAYDWILEDVKWFGLTPDLVTRASDRMDIYYGVAAETLKKGVGYVCTCDSEKWKKLIDESKACPCRELPSGKQHERWLDMLNGGLKEGEAVFRIKTDLSHPNPAVRDWPALRIIDAPHPRVGTKYRVWPLYNFASAVDDHELGITHVMRGQQHTNNSVRQSYLFKYMRWKEPVWIHHGHLSIEGIELSKSKIVAGMESGSFEDWDDPRLGTLRALRRRGFQPETIIKLMERVGIKPSDATVSLENLAAENKKIVDPIANRYHFVADPVKLKITGLKKKHVAELPLHPEDKVRGVRRVEIADEVYISKEDWDAFKGKTVRLKGLFNVKLGHVVTYEGDDVVTEMPKIQWVKEGIKATLVMPDASHTEGFVETAIIKELVGKVVQFERVGFVRIDSKEPFVAYYTHR